MRNIAGKILRLAALGGLAAVLAGIAPGAAPAVAATPLGRARTADSGLLVDRAQAWLDALPESRMEIEVARDGRRATGRIFLDRAHRRARIEIDAPFRDTVIVNGSLIHAETGNGSVLRQATRASPLRFMVAPTRLADTAVVLGADMEGDRASLALGERDRPRAGSIVLEFKRNAGWNLVGWQLVDPRGVRTDVRIDYIESGVTLADALFEVPHDRGPDSFRGGP